MDQIDRAMIRYVSETFHSVQKDGWPYGVWVRRYSPVPSHFSNDEDIKTPLLHAWFVGPQGVSQDNAAFQRFEVMHLQQPWATRVVNTHETLTAPGTYFFSNRSRRIRTIR